MDPPEHGELTRRQRRLLKRSEKQVENKRGRKTTSLKRWLGRLLILSVLGGGVGLAVWSITNQKPIAQENIISRSGLHWHPELTITVKGEQVPVEENLGIGAVHTPIHTHEDLPTLHLEFRGRVLKDDLRLAQFFKVWGKRFSSDCILDSCNRQDRHVKMVVNGQSNTEFDQYVMQDKDKIEIRYE